MTAIEDARRLLAGITPGPWMDDPERDDNQQRRIVARGGTICDEIERDQDADFIVAAPALVASLADTIEAVQAWLLNACPMILTRPELYDAGHVELLRLVSPEATEATK
jgi:hypothetical protein